MSARRQRTASSGPARTRHLLMVGVLPLLLLPSGARAQGYVQNAIAVFGEPAPDTGTTFLQFGIPSIAGSGPVAFEAKLADQRWGIFLSSGGALTTIAQTGAIEEAFDPHPPVNSAGDVAFGALGIGIGNALVEVSGGVSSNVRIPGDPAPVPGGATYSSLQNPSPVTLSPSGDIAFTWGHTGGSTGCLSGLFSIRGGVDTAIALSCETAPGTGGGTHFVLLGSWMNPSGVVAFGSAFAGGVAPQGGFAIFVGSGGPVTPVVVPGDAAPETGGGSFDVSFLVPSALTINASGDVVFYSSITGGTVPAGVFLSSGGVITALVLAGAPAPGTGGGNYSAFRGASMNEAGDIVFVADVSGGTTTEGIFVSSGGTQRAVARRGDPAPGTGGSTYGSLNRPVIDDAGVVSFSAGIDANSGVFQASRVAVPFPRLPWWLLPTAGIAFAIAGSLATLRRRTWRDPMAPAGPRTEG